MENKQINIVREVKKILKSISNIDYVGYYPQDVEKLSDRDFAVLIQAGDEEWESYPARKYTCIMTLSIHLYTVDAANHILTITTNQNSIVDALLDSVTLNNKATCIELLSVDTGDWSDTFDRYSAGYTDNIQHRIINFSVRFDTNR